MRSFLLFMALKRVILIGWSGAKFNHVKKYIELYNKIGFNDVKVYCPSIIEPVQGYGLYNAKNNISHLLAETNYIHCFSGGYYLYLMSLDRQSDNSYRGRANKLIIDSAPIEPIPQSVSRYIREILKINIQDNSVSDKMVRSIFKNVWDVQGFFYYNHRIKKDKNMNYNFQSYSNMIEDEIYRRVLDVTTSPKNTLCVYSKSDKVLDIEFTKKMIRHHNWKSLELADGQHARLLTNKTYVDQLYHFYNL